MEERGQGLGLGSLDESHAGVDTNRGVGVEPAGAAMDEPAAAAVSQVGGRRMLVRRVLAPAPADAGALLAESERARLQRLANLLLLAFIGAGVALMPVALALGQPLVPLTGLIAAAMLAAVLNRLGWTRAAMSLAVLACDAWIALAFAAAPAGNADLLWALLLPTLLVAVFLPSRACLPFGLAQCALAVGLVFVAGVGGDPRALLSARVLAYLERPLAGQLAVAVLAYAWVRGMTGALAAADRSAEILALRQREAQRKRALDEGVRELLAAHAQLANGNFDVAVPELADATLWRIGHSLNALRTQLRRFAEVDSLLVQTYEEAEHLAGTLRRRREGAAVAWPKPNGTPLDPILVALAAGAPAPVSVPAQPAATPAAVVEADTERPPVISMPLKRGLAAPPRLVQTRIPENQETRRMDFGPVRRSAPFLDGLESEIEQVLVLRARDGEPERRAEA